MQRLSRFLLCLLTLLGLLCCGPCLAEEDELQPIARQPLNELRIVLSEAE